MKGFIFDIKRFATHDGKGIRTTVFFKGCSLSCKWCHNPESISPQKQIGYFPDKCINCGNCTSVCEANVILGGKHIFERTKCVLCGKCTEVCPKKCFEIYGYEISADTLVPILLKDKKFYDVSGGGVTLSGGECLLQYEFCREVLIRLKKLGINTAIDTAGLVPQKAIDAVAPYTDIFLYDIKHFDSVAHTLWTGHGNEEILKNLRYINSLGSKIEIRIPYIPGVNHNSMGDIAQILQELENITAVKILPYHPYARSKYIAVDKDFSMKDTPIPSPKEIQAAKNIFKEYGFEVI